MNARHCNYAMTVTMVMTSVSVCPSDRGADVSLFRGFRGFRRLRYGRHCRRKSTKVFRRAIPVAFVLGHSRGEDGRDWGGHVTFARQRVLHLAKDLLQALIVVPLKRKAILRNEPKNTQLNEFFVYHVSRT